MKPINRIHFALQLSARHLIISLIVAVLSALFVFFILYPYPYYQITGSISIFLTMLLVDVCSGPLCTLVVASPNKKRKEVILDFTLIGAIQLAALAYGLFSLYSARPVYEVYEKENFRIVLANEVQIDEFPNANPQFRKLPKLGITQLGVRQARDSKEQIESINMSIAGIEIGLRPSWWVPYNDVIINIKKHYKPISTLFTALSKEEQITLSSALNKYKLNKNNTYFLPLDNSKYKQWIILLNKDGKVTGYAPVDGYRLEQEKK